MSLDLLGAVLCCAVAVDVLVRSKNFHYRLLSTFHNQRQYNTTTGFLLHQYKPNTNRIHLIWWIFNEHCHFIIYSSCSVLEFYRLFRRLKCNMFHFQRWCERIITHNGLLTLRNYQKCTTFYICTKLGWKLILMKKSQFSFYRFIQFEFWFFSMKHSLFYPQKLF